MTDEERIDLFLETFKELEKEVVSQSQIRDSDYVSFSRALFPSKEKSDSF